jgi:hypothetical protein
VKDQYFGDARDYLKYHLLQELVTSVPSVRQLTCLWMLTPPDRTGHGKVPFVRNDELPALSDFLASSITRGERRVHLLRTYFADQGIAYRPHGDKGPPYFSAASRVAYFQSVPSDDLIDATVFCDPDVGITWGKPTAKHVHIDEIRVLWNRMGDTSVLVVVQFAQRKPNFFPAWGKALEQACPAPVRWVQEYPAAFFVIPKPGVDTVTVDRAMRDVVACAGRHRLYGRASDWTIPGARRDVMRVYLLWHAADPDDLGNACLLGVYSSREKAEARQREAAMLPGFRRVPTGFVIDEYAVDEHHWREGTSED